MRAASAAALPPLAERMLPHVTAHLKGEKAKSLNVIVPRKASIKRLARCSAGKVDEQPCRRDASGSVSAPATAGSAPTAARQHQGARACVWFFFDLPTLTHV